MTEALRFVVIGAGGIGSVLARYLAMMLEFKVPGSGLIICDGDHFEPKNKERQLFQQFGNKAESLATDIAPGFNKTFVVPVAKWVVEEIKEGSKAEDIIAAKDLIMEKDVIFPVVDNFKARGLVFDAASNLKDVDVISAGNDEALFASLYHYRRRDGKDISVHPRHIHPEYEDPPDRNPGELSCQERAAIDGGTQLVAANLAAAALILGKVQSAIFDQVEYGEPNHEIYLDIGEGLAQPYDRSAEQILATTGV